MHLISNQLNLTTKKVNFGILLQLKMEIKEMMQFTITLVLIDRKSSNKFKNTLEKKDKAFMLRHKLRQNTNKKHTLLSLVNKQHHFSQVLAKIK